MITEASFTMFNPSRLTLRNIYEVTILLGIRGTPPIVSSPCFRVNLTANWRGDYERMRCRYHLMIEVSSKLNLHKFQHNFRDTLDPICPSNDGSEDTEHFLLLCPSFDLQRQDLAILRSFGLDNLSNKVLTQYLLLYGNKGLPIDLNREILELTLAFIHNTGRFD